MSLETIYGYWNPVPVMASTVAIAAVLFLLIWLVYKSRHSRLTPSGVARFYAFHRSALNASVIPVASAFWDGVSGLTIGAAGWMRRIYTGDGQTYALHILHYVVVLYLISTQTGG